MSRIVSLLLRFYSLFVRKTSDYIIFESASDFFDNAYSLYKYIKEHYPNFKRKYLVTNVQMRKKAALRGVNEDEMLDPSKKLQLYKYSLKSKLIVFSYTNYWKKLPLPKSVKVVHTGHGEFPVKSCDDYIEYLCGKQENKIDVAYVTEEVRDIMRKRYPVLNNHNLVVLGTPRSDLMFHPNVKKNDLLNIIDVEDIENKKIILSMTTFRHEHVQNLNYFKDEFPVKMEESEVKDIDNLLGKNNLLLLIKLHPSQSGVIIPKKYQNIRFITNADLAKINTEITELYSIADYLISDYSSGFVGYLSLDRKMGFLLADKKQYSSIRGYTLENFDEYLPGEKVYSLEEFKKFISNLNSPEDTYKEERRRVKLIFAGDYKDQNCKSYTDYYLENKKDQ